MAEINVRDHLILGEEVPRYYFPRKGPDKDAAMVRMQIMLKIADNLVGRIKSDDADFREVPDDLMNAYDDLIIRMHAIANYEKKIALGER